MVGFWIEIYCVEPQVSITKRFDSSLVHQTKPKHFIVRLFAQIINFLVIFSIYMLRLFWETQINCKKLCVFLCSLLLEFNWAIGKMWNLLLRAFWIELPWNICVPSGRLFQNFSIIGSVISRIWSWWCEIMYVNWSPLVVVT